MSAIGTPKDGKTPAFSVSTSVATQIPRYSVVSALSTANLTVTLMDASVTDSRNRACGFSNVEWPRVSQIHTPTPPAGQTVTRLSATESKLPVAQEGYSWMLVKIGLGGSDVAIKPGDDLCPSAAVDGSVGLVDASALTGSYVSAAILEDFADWNRTIAKAYSMIHVPTAGRWPSIGGGTQTNSLTALTDAVTFGYVFGKITL